MAVLTGIAEVTLNFAARALPPPPLHFHRIHTAHATAAISAVTSTAAKTDQGIRMVSPPALASSSGRLNLAVVPV